MKNLYISLFFAFFSLFCSAQNILYVSINQFPAQDGKSWQTAFGDLNTALTAARYGDQIWVAAGTYRPGTDDNRRNRFELKNGVQLYGGFSGNETAVEQRDWQTFLTVLSGEIGQAGRADNVYHVVYGKGLDSTTVLDGFSITGAYGVVAFEEEAAFNNCGGGVLLFGKADMNSRPVIRNCHIYENACNYGGGLYISRRDLRFPDSIAGPVNPVVEGCTFERNYAFWSGGAIFKTGGTAADDTIRVRNTVFRRNRARAGFGGGICLNNTTDLILWVEGCLFERDSALEGGGVFYESGNQTAQKQHFIFKNTDFKSNYARGEGAGFYYFGSSISDPEIKNITVMTENCTLQDNKAGSGGISTFSIFKKDVRTFDLHMNNTQFIRNRGGIATFSAEIDLKSGVTQVNTHINKCLFQSNFETSVRLLLGGVFNNHINNCIFKENERVLDIWQAEESKGNTLFTNCTFYNNTNIFAKSFYQSYLSSSEYYNNLTVRNSIIYHTDTSYYSIFSIHPDFPPLYFHIYQYFFQNTAFNTLPITLIPRNPTVFAKSVDFNVEPEFISPATGNFRLQSCSPVIGRGDNQYVREAGITTDIEERPRILFQNVDLGAYEQPDSCGVSRTVEVRPLRPVACWPNPARDARLLWSAEGADLPISHITISDATGRTVATRHHAPDTRSGTWETHLGAGVCFVRFFTEQGVQCQKWVVP
jgi:hypothetical protein